MVIYFNEDIMLPYDKRLIERSRQLRNEMTPAEKYIWARLKNKQLGYLFYRQKPVGIFIADFYCPHIKLVIEIDGGQHFTKEARKYDRERSAFFVSIKLRVLRFTNKEVLSNITAVLEKIKIRAKMTSLHSIIVLV
jgi:very-short-patch-repair endonuclease